MPGRGPASNGAFPVERITAGVDWITHITDGRQSTDALVSALEPIARDLARGGHKRRPFRFMRWQGEALGPLRLGIRGDTAVAQLSGELCNTSWTLLASSLGRTTRLDLQTTLELSESHKQFARRLLRPSAKTLRMPPESRIPTFYSSGTSGLRIGTVGQRTNRRYLRVYDKGVETGTKAPGLLWRVELEAKRDLAPKLWNRLKQEPDVPKMCYGSCAHAWKQSGLRWPLPKPGKGFEVPPPDPKTAPPAHALGAWLRTSVAPTIPRILGVYSVADVLDMLGMSHLAIPRTEGPNDA